MKAKQHYSSSKGNLYSIEASGGGRLLLDAGVVWAKLQKALDYDLSNIEACCISTSHKDHCKALEDVLQAGIDVYAGESTFRSIEDSLHLHRRATAVKDGDRVDTESFVIIPFNTIHDAEESLGYVIKEKSSCQWLLFAPESAYMQQEFDVSFNIIMIECNYDNKVLSRRVEAGEIHEEVAKRIAGSHAEKATVMSYLQNHCDLTYCRQIHLIHCSAANLDKKKAKKEFEEKLFIDVVIKGL